MRTRSPLLLILLCSLCSTPVLANEVGERQSVQPGASEDATLPDEDGPVAPSEDLDPAPTGDESATAEAEEEQDATTATNVADADAEGTLEESEEPDEPTPTLMSAQTPAERMRARRLARLERRLQQLEARAAEIAEEHATYFGDDMSDQSAERLALIEELRCDGQDAASCFAGDLQGVLVEGASLEQDVSEAEVLSLLHRVLERQISLEVQIERAAEELEQAHLDELAYFGRGSHVTNPPSEFYLDPVASIEDFVKLDLSIVDPADFDFPIVITERVRGWMRYFLGRGRRWMARCLGRADYYGPYIQQQLRESGLPTDLLYLSFIESGFNPLAISRAGAVGMWQFMPRTGTAFGLERNSWVDERRDPILSTHGAIAYLSYLYDFFDGDWALAASAYNAGQGRIRNALRDTGTSDYWELTETDILRDETRDYVPKLIAVAILAHYADHYGLSEEIPEEERREGHYEFDFVIVPDSTDLSVIAEVIEVEEEAIVALNPGLRVGYTPPRQDYLVKVPLGTAEGFVEAFDALPVQERLSFQRYRVRRGDTLGRIAARHGVPWRSVAQLNDISNPNRLRVGQTLVIPGRSGTPSGDGELAEGQNTAAAAFARWEAAMAEADTSDATEIRMGVRGSDPLVMEPEEEEGAVASTETIRYRVQSGDTLSTIASREGITVGDLRDWNGLTTNRIFVGQELRLSADARLATAVSDAPPPELFHTVARGETGSEIGERYHVRWSEIRSHNGLSSDSLRVGQTLRIPVTSESARSARAARPSSGQQTTASTASASSSSSGGSSGATPRRHTVRSGDTLSGIASRYGVSTGNLREWNSIRGDTIRPGQRLRVEGRPTREATYRVASGDTLSEIAIRFGVSQADLRRWNNLSGSRIRSGQRLTMRVPVEQGSSDAGSGDDLRVITYRVRSGDTLSRIASANGVRVSDIMDWNEMSRDTVYVGQRLTLRVAHN